MTAQGTYDVVIVGGGAIGSAIAYWLTRDAAWRGRVAVVERDPTYARASSALSASSIRQQFSTPLNIHLSRFGIGFLRQARELLSVDGEPPVELGLREPGYLFLASAAGEAILRDNHAIQRREDCAVELLAPDALKQRFAWIDTDGVVLASHGVANEGWFDGPALMQAFRRKARAQGAVYVHDEVTGLDTDSGRVTTVRLASGRALAASQVVNAAGCWSARVAAMAGVALPVEARRRSVFVFDCREKVAPAPLVIDTSGAWFRPEGKFFIGGISPPEEQDPPDLPLEANHAEWDELVWPALAARVPAFGAVKVVNSWAGYYEYNTFDHNGIVGPHPELANLVFATGFSGHGIQQSPAVGRAIAEWLTQARYVSLDLTPFGFDRIAANRPIIERNVV
ncbi:FAD-binding oxidoreductase [Vineibacter terrae]|uniref:FAD-binding oxidoreductase n=1 Tax=Vineibacter terrae TaxID=2586908 RepID=A0A5C8PK27_9HYPH|nr:FAD-binding oxidoreductase [Vineibacter terrae]TXL73712.1 FAD-binding oxidoreductase [Vineibacter terrae]